MKHQTDSFIAVPAPDASGRAAMKAALREFRGVARKLPQPHPKRAEMLSVLADARIRIDRINARQG